MHPGSSPVSWANAVLAAGLVNCSLGPTELARMREKVLKMSEEEKARVPPRPGPAQLFGEVAISVAGV